MIGPNIPALKELKTGVKFIRKIMQKPLLNW